MVKRTDPKRGAQRRAATLVAAGWLGASAMSQAATLATTLQADTIGSTTFLGYAPFLELYSMEELTITEVSWMFDPNGSEASITASLVDVRDGTVMGEFETKEIVDEMAIQSLSTLGLSGITIPAGTPFAILVNGHGEAEFPMVEMAQNESSALQYFGTRAYFVESIPGQSLRNFIGSASFSIEGDSLTGSASAIPEPSPVTALIGGLGFLLIIRRR